jgi:glycosyltransferase involved in cell wall biosynthesis
MDWFYLKNSRETGIFMKSKINLVILTPGFAAHESDSTAIPSLQLFLANLHLYYPEIHIHIVSFHYPFPSGHYYWKGFPVYAAGGSRWKPFKIFLWIRILSYLFKLRKECGIDIVQTFWLTDTTLIGILFGRMTGIPVVSTSMGQDVIKQNKYLWLIRLFKPDLITISKFQANSLHVRFRTNMLTVIPFGVDPSYNRKRREERNIDILGVGSLNKTKNYLNFIEIIDSLVKIYPGLNCGIIGEGNEREEIEKFIINNNLEKRIILFGQLPYEKVIEKMQETKILLHTAVFEGQGLVITEALAAGAYVVCYPVGIAWNRENKKLRTGRTKEELKQHIIEILNDRKPDYTQEIFYTIEDTCRDYNEIYHTLVPSK